MDAENPEADMRRKLRRAVELKLATKDDEMKSPALEREFNKIAGELLKYYLPIVKELWAAGMISAINISVIDDDGSTDDLVIVGVTPDLDSAGLIMLEVEPTPPQGSNMPLHPEAAA